MPRIKTISQLVVASAIIAFMVSANSCNYASSKNHSATQPVIVIDPGHGGTSNAGRSDANHAIGPNGTLEKALTLSLSVKVAEILGQQGYKVVLTRSDDSNLGLPQRAKMGSDNNAEVFLSIHFNGDANNTIQGVETWVHPASGSDSKLFATALVRDIVAASGNKNRGVKSNDWGVLDAGIQSPVTAACLLEVSFLTDPNEENRLIMEDYKNKLAAAIANTIINYINHSTGANPIQPIPATTPANGGDG